MQSGDPLVSAEWLKSHLTAPDVRVIDATWVPPWSSSDARTASRKLYLEGHIPGAVYFDIDEVADESTDLPHMVPSAEKFSSRARRMGLGDGKTLVVYDRGGFVASARVWWMFRLMGHNDVKVLDGGWNAWVDAGGAVEDLEPIVSERHFTVRFQNQLIKSLEQMKQAVSEDTLTILDARPSGRFTGKDKEPRPGLSSGHMPGSFSLPSSELISKSGLMKSESELKDLLETYDGMTNVTASCGSGVTAAIIALAFSRIGQDGVAVYDGSWTEWASQTGAPIVTS